ncbi:Rz1-like lysis system protein LysC [Thalassospira indica]|uniref:Rz1-like lysis system protein LysC n=1 Tax=Thalassospira indica TaxID=1891279 RepID=UPI003CCC842E
MHRIMAVSALLFMPLLTACASSPPITQIKTVRTVVPAALTNCKERPRMPAPPVTDQKVGRLIVDLIDAHDDCFGKNQRIRELQETEHAKTD